MAEGLVVPMPTMLVAPVETRSPPESVEVALVEVAFRYVPAIAPYEVMLPAKVDEAVEEVAKKYGAEAER